MPLPRPRSRRPADDLRLAGIQLLRRPGLRWKLTVAIALVSALVALSLASWCTTPPGLSMLNNSRDLQDDRVQVASRNYESTDRLMFGARINDPRLPDGLRQAAAQGQRATDVQDGRRRADRLGRDPDAGQRTILSLSSRFSEPLRGPGGPGPGAGHRLARSWCWPVPRSAC